MRFRKTSRHSPARTLEWPRLVGHGPQTMAPLLVWGLLGEVSMKKSAEREAIQFIIKEMKKRIASKEFGEKPSPSEEKKPSKVELQDDDDDDDFGDAPPSPEKPKKTILKSFAFKSK